MTCGIMNLRENDTGVSLSCIIRSCVLGSYDHADTTFGSTIGVQCAPGMLLTDLCWLDFVQWLPGRRLI